ncbi:Hsp70 family protein [Nocardia transvalensis]|uniref:Hsp70 family protein n=1 Tax=Nocardia transvalensis TaxID=37333 RepID=UPI0018962D50|nr:Hsp70 family protein [Nocardia transvalensis]MBF6327055.1 Hsp70 family protein [Nocardia transvalensis]
MVGPNTVGVGIGVGAVNTVSAAVCADSSLSVTTRPTAVAVDSGGAVTDFADLARRPETVTVGGRLWSPANLTAALVGELLGSVPPAAGVVATYPACYDDKQVALLRQAFDLTGARRVRLLPEPVAAVAWLEHEHGPLRPGFVLVYDLGATSLDVTVVEVADGEDRRIIGSPLRSYDFGGRPLGAMIVRYVGEVMTPVDGELPSSVADSDELRGWHVRDSLAVVWDCLRAAQLSIGDIGRILVVGGAARAPEVARVLAELGPPVVMSADPGHCAASGAALAAVPPADHSARERRIRPTLVSGAAALSVLALSAASLLTSSGDSDALWTQVPVIDRLPGPESGAQAEVGAGFPEPVLSAAVADTAPDPAQNSAPASDSAPPASVGTERPLSDSTPAQVPAATYGDPSRFSNPLPFDAPAAPTPRGDHSGTEPSGITIGQPATTSPTDSGTSGSATDGSSSTAGQGDSTTGKPNTPAGQGTSSTGTDSSTGQGNSKGSSTTGTSDTRDTTSETTTGGMTTSGTSPTPSNTGSPSGTAVSGDTSSAGSSTSASTSHAPISGGTATTGSTGASATHFSGGGSGFSGHSTPGH